MAFLVGERPRLVQRWLERIVIPAAATQTGSGIAKARTLPSLAEGERLEQVAVEETGSALGDHFAGDYDALSKAPKKKLSPRLGCGERARLRSSGLS